MKRLFVAVAIALSAIPLAAQQQPPKFGENVDVNLVLIDALVTDNKGNQILGLGKDDFVVKENGVVQPIDAVEYYTNRTMLNAREANAPFKVEKANDQRFFIFFLDKPEGGEYWGDVKLVLRGIRDFVEKDMRPGDLVAIAGFDARLNIYSDFTSDKKQLLDSIDKLGTFSKGMKSGSGPIMAAMDADQMMSGTGTVYEAFETLADALKKIRGRKNMIVFSAGIYEPGQEIREGMIVNESRFYRPMIRSLNAANVSVYGANLLAPRSADLIPAAHQMLEQISNDTGGEYTRHVTTFGPFVKRIEQQNSGYYLLTYYAHHEKGTSGFQKVDVSVKPRGLRVKARAGYPFGQ